MSGPPIVFCETCACDTLPLPSGLCAFCDTRLVARKARPVKPRPVAEKQPAAWWVRRQQRLGLWP